jgi:preprotein translocase subunit SecY
MRLSAFANCFKIPELRQRILFTLGLVFICRIIDCTPTPGVDAGELQRVIREVQSQAGGGFLGWIDVFSGGALSNCAVGALAIWPYISASIILQLMTAIVPALGRIVREGDTGRQKINQYTRYLTVLICLVQGYFLAITLENPQALGLNAHIVHNPGIGFRLLTMVTMTTGTMLMMWLGEQITERGIGNGISMIIMVNIVSRLPNTLVYAANMFRSVDGQNAQFSLFHLVGLLVLFFLVICLTIALTQAQRKVPIHTAKRVVGQKQYGGQTNFMPLRVNYSGVMPLIFAGAVLTFPVILLKHLKWGWARDLSAALGMGEPLYLAFYAILILFFSYFWVATQFNPLQIADDLKRNGGYVPGIRPGRPTAEYLDSIMTRLTLFGALLLTVIAVLPDILATQFRIPWLVASFMGGTSLLIVVGVALDTMRQVESHLMMRHYDGFLSRGRLRGRR